MIALPLWGFVLALFCAASWAVSPIASDRGTELGKCTSNEINPVRSWSFFLTALICVLITEHGRIPAVRSAEIHLLFFAGIILNYIMGDVFYYVAIRLLGVSIAIPIANAYPVFIVFFAAPVLNERISPLQMAAVFIVVSGIALLKTGGQHSQSFKKTNRQWAIGLLLTVSAGLCWAGSSVTTKLILQKTGMGAAVFSFYRALWLIPTAWAVHKLTEYLFPGSTVPVSSIPLKAKACYWLSGIIGLGLGYMVYAYCVKTLPVALVTPITATSPLMAALYAHFVMKQKLSAMQWAGVAMIISGSVMVGI